MANTPNRVAAFWKRLGGQNQTIVAAVGGVIIFAVVVIGIIRVASAISSPPSPTPNPAQQAAENVVKQFYTDVEQQDYKAAWNLFTMQQQLPFNETAFAYTLASFNQKYGAITAFHELRYDQDKNTANQVIVQESVTRHTTYTVELTLQLQTDGTWKLSNEMAQEPNKEPPV